MRLLDAALRRVFDLLLTPASALAPGWSLLILSALAAAAMLLVFRATSNQDGLRRVKRHIHACLFEMRLFNDDLVAILRAQIEILRHNATYLGLSLVPMLWILPPLVLTMLQLDTFYGSRALHPGEATVVEAHLTDAGAVERPDAVLAAPEGLVVDTPAVWIPAQRRVAWRVRAVTEGTYHLRLTVAGRSYTKRVVVSFGVVRKASTRPARTFLAQLLNPGEEALPDGGEVTAITVGYPRTHPRILGAEPHWMVSFFVFCMVFVFALRKPLGVVI